MDSIKSKILPPYCSSKDSDKDEPDQTGTSKEKTAVNELWEPVEEHRLNYFLKEFNVELDNGHIENIESLWPTIENNCLVFKNVNTDKIPLKPDRVVADDVIYISDMVHLSKLGSSVSESVDVESVTRFSVNSTYEVKIVDYDSYLGHYTDEYRDLNIRVDEFPAEYKDEPEIRSYDETIKEMLVNNE